MSDLKTLADKCEAAQLNIRQAFEIFTECAAAEQEAEAIWDNVQRQQLEKNIQARIEQAEISVAMAIQGLKQVGDILGFGEGEEGSTQVSLFDLLGYDPTPADEPASNDKVGLDLADEPPDFPF